jgi:hypothetical protein
VDPIVFNYTGINFVFLSCANKGKIILKYYCPNNKPARQPKGERKVETRTGGDSAATLKPASSPPSRCPDYIHIYKSITTAINPPKQGILKLARHIYRPS